MGGVGRLPGAFQLLMAAQLFSLLGTDVVKFALRVWTYHQTRSVTQFGLLTFFAEMPALLLAPVAGSVVDRCNRKHVMLLADTLAALSTVGLALCHYSSRALTPDKIYAANLVASVMNAFQWPAFRVASAQLVSSDQQAQAGGMLQAVPALSMLLAPALGAYVLEAYGLDGAFLCEVGTFAVCVLVTSLVAVPKSAPPNPLEHVSLLNDARAAWNFIRLRRGLVALLGLLFAGFFASGLIQVLMTPLVLNFADPVVLGSVLTLSGVGAIVGAAGLSMYHRPIESCSQVVLYAFGLQGALLIACGLVPRASVILAVAFLYMAVIPVVRSCREAIWFRKTPPHLQGRVLALQRGISQFALPLASIIAGPLVDGVFEPLMAPAGALAPSVGAVIGTGPGRGAALLFVLTGLANLGIAAAGLSYAPLRDIDALLPDVGSVDAGDAATHRKPDSVKAD